MKFPPTIRKILIPDRSRIGQQENRVKSHAFSNRPLASGEDLLDEVTMHISQSHIPTTEAEGTLRMVNTE